MRELETTPGRTPRPARLLEPGLALARGNLHLAVSYDRPQVAKPANFQPAGISMANLQDLQPAAVVRRILPDALAIGLAAVVLGLLLSIHVTAPWIYLHDDNGAWTQMMASAHLRAGLAATGGQGAMVRRADGGLDRYLHHPPLYPLIVAAVYRATGRSDTAITRLVPAFFHFVGFAAAVALAFILFPASPARRLVAVGLYALVPMSAYFGKMPNFEPVGLAWVNLAMVATCRHRRSGGRLSLALAVVFWVLAGLTSWGAYAAALGFVALFAFEGWRERRPERSRAALVLGASAGGTAALVLAQIRIIAGNSSNLLGAGGHWATTSATPAEVLAALGTAFDFNRIYFANVPFLLYIAWAFSRLRALLSGVRLNEDQRVLCAGSAGVALYALAFLPALAIHAYGQFWFLPFEVLAAADVALAAWERLGNRRRMRLALAGLAVAGTLASAAYTLAYRYSRPHGYAVRTARFIAERYYTTP